MKLVYALSAEFPYHKMIHFDAGPPFATDYGWPTASIADLEERDDDVVIADNRMMEAELPALERIAARPGVVLFLRMVDPYLEHTSNHPWYLFCRRMLQRSNVVPMLTYPPAEWTGVLCAAAAPSGFVFTPYVYDERLERPINHAVRQHKVVLSGAQSSNIYPLRHRMRMAFACYPPLRRMRAILPHPGYPDIGVQGAANAKIGSAYIDALARFRFAAVCSSRCRLEFLKYREFAYAGVVPVGDFPATLFDCPAGTIVPWRRNIVKLGIELSRMTDTAGRAERFRAFMRERRGIEQMRASVLSQIEAALAHRCGAA